MKINQENTDRLPELVSEIHDMWFSVEQVIFDEPKHEFVLFFGITPDLFDQCLKVKGVLACQIKDTEKVGTYDIDYLSVDLRKSTISLVGCITIKIILKVAPNFEIITEKRK